MNPACYIWGFRRIIGSHMLMTDVIECSIEMDAKEIPGIVRGMLQRPAGTTMSQQL
jgi:hypothetical protein